MASMLATTIRDSSSADLAEATNNYLGAVGIQGEAASAGERVSFDQQ